MRERHPSFNIAPAELARGADVAGQALDWAGGISLRDRS